MSVRNHALAASVVINVVLAAVLTATSWPASRAEPTADRIPADLSEAQIFRFYTKALDAERDKVFVVSSLYCNGLSSTECRAKVEAGVRTIGGETEKRYQALTAAEAVPLAKRW